MPPDGKKYNINDSDTSSSVDEMMQVAQVDIDEAFDIPIGVSQMSTEDVLNEISTGRNKYLRRILPGVWVDVYDVIAAFEVNDGGMQHALKKILACGQRGHKDEAEDRKDILASIKRSNEIFERGL